MRPPKHLSLTARKLWRDICASHEVAHANQFALLRSACEAFDRAEGARQILAAEGITTKDRFGQLRAHPACAIERDARGQMIACFRALGLSDPDPFA
jgi:P27 family predicted phage terminase small subunit